MLVMIRASRLIYLNGVWELVCILNVAKTSLKQCPPDSTWTDRDDIALKYNANDLQHQYDYHSLTQYIYIYICIYIYIYRERVNNMQRVVKNNTQLKKLI